MVRWDSDSVDWAFKHLELEGDTDLFPKPFEIDALLAWPELKNALLRADITNYSWRGKRRFVVPKRLLAFRFATQLDPLDSLVLAALTHQYGPRLEAKRIPIDESRVFSHRLKPSSTGRLYAEKPGWNEFWKTSLEKAEGRHCGAVLAIDIADFYNQIYHHTIESRLAAALPAPVVKIFKIFLQTLTDKVSRGIPVGPHCSHILAEIALDPVDRSLLSQGYDFCRYIDDIHIFCRDHEEATGALYDLVASLDKQQKLQVQNEKTKIYSRADFVSFATDKLNDRPATDQEKEVLDIISSATGGERYEDAPFSSIDPDDLHYVSKESLEQLVAHYLGESPDYPRLSWLLRRLSQVGAPGAIEYVLQHIPDLGPILGSACHYVVSSFQNYRGDRKKLGQLIVEALDNYLVSKSPYLQAILMDVLAALPELNHIDRVTSRYKASDDIVRRKIILAAANGNRPDWLREIKDNFRNLDPWSRRAFVKSSSLLPKEEAQFWLQAVASSLTSLEKVVARHAFGDPNLKLGIIDIIND